MQNTGANIIKKVYNWCKLLGKLLYLPPNTHQKAIMNDISKNILERVSQFMATNDLLQKEDPLVFVGLSGGSDSVALIHILRSLGYNNVIATHCNFQLRGEESERDQRFCQNLCRELKVKLLMRRFNTTKYMEEHRLSLEMACRELRYNWWKELLASNDYSTRRFNRFIAVGHHIDDSIETILMNLMRGTGIKGLTGIIAHNRQTHVVRPLLCLTRTDIIDYVTSCNLSFVTDSTNRENDCQRNNIRNRLLPLMEEINPNARRGIVKTMHNLQDIERIAYNEIGEKLDEHVMVENRNQHTIRHLVTQDMDVHRNDFPVLVREFLLSQGVKLHPNTLAEVIESARDGERKIFQGDNYWICNSEVDLIAEPHPINLDNEVYTIKGITFQPENNVLDMFNIFETTPQQIDSLKVDPTMTLIDPDKVRLPLIIRHWREGDRILPFGRKQTKLVSDLMTDAHFNWWQKTTNWIVTDSDNQILWVYGLRSSEIAKVSKDTKRIVAIIGPD